MPATQRLITDRGVTFANHMVTTPICCPSRVNLLRGQLSHNTNFTDVLGPHGGYAKFRSLGLDREWLPGWLQREGYSTLYTGKFIVDYTIRNRDPPPAGWSAFDALVHPFTFEYYCPAFSLNGGPPRMYPAQYVTDVLSSKAQALLRSAAADPEGRPFYLQVAPPAPHHSMHYDYSPNGTLLSRHWYPPVPAARHWELFSDAALPRQPSFNQRDMAGKPAWMRQLQSLTPGNQTFLEEVFRLRLRSLRAVDEMVEALASLLDSLGLADSTYVLLTSDNGYHEGAHRMGSGKTTAYEEDLLVPLIVAGPGLLPSSRVDAPTAHIDIAPTVLALAGAPLPAALDGTPLPLAAVSNGALPASYPYGGPQQEPLRGQLLAEFWGEWADESIHSHLPYRNHTWKAVRVLRSGGGGGRTGVEPAAEAYKYVIHCSGEYELYDLARDPYELVNLLDQSAPVGTLEHVADANGQEGAVRTAHGDPGEHKGGCGRDQRAGDDNNVISNCESRRRRLAVSTPRLSLPAAIRAWAATAWAALTTVRTHGSSAHGSEPAARAKAVECRQPISKEAAVAVQREPLLEVRGGAQARREYAVWLRRLLSRLDALLAVLAVCSGGSCVRPFQVIHPDGAVSDLWAAMDERYDALYDGIEPFAFGHCLPYQDVDNERSPFRGAVAKELESAGPDGSCGGEAPAPGAPARAAPVASGDSNGNDAAAASRATGARATLAAGAVELLEADSVAAFAGLRDSVQSRGRKDHAAEGGGGAGADPGGGQQARQRRANLSPLPLVEADVEADAVPLPRKYELVVDVYGSSAAGDAMLLA